MSVGLISLDSTNGQDITFSTADVNFFENKIRPILSEHCSECHSGAADSQRGGFSISSRGTLIAGGDTGRSIEPGKPDKSLLIDSINYRGHYDMPPSSKLPQEKIELLEEWVKRGAPWSDFEEHAALATEKFDLEKRKSQHWAWQPVKKTIPPVIEGKFKTWALDSIDNFVLRGLSEHNLTPASEAERHVWIRRVYFDLVGLPPEPEAIDNFLNDDSPTAYEKVVDQLLASPAFGERWARHWMDLVRYAETYGHEFDFPIAHAWEYRDYLIRAFNNDVPYDDFVKEHIAGDLLESPRLHSDEGYNESIIGTGFWFFGEATHGPVDVRADEAGRIANQIDVLCKTFQGLTVACARCHDHKFDAISTKDYYALSGILQSTRRQLGVLDSGNKIANAAQSAVVTAAKYDLLVKPWLEELKTYDEAKWRSELSQLENNDVEQAEFRFNFRSIMENKLLKAPEHPFHLLRLASENDQLLVRLQIRAVAKAIDEQQQRRQAFLASSELFENFDNDIPANWFKAGTAFHSSDLPLQFSSHGDLISTGSLATTTRLGNRFQGAIRSPTFEITHDKFAIRAKSDGCKIRMVIDGYQMDTHNPLLFKGCSILANQAKEFTWVLLDTDVKNYKGHRAYLELLDHGDRFMQVDEIRLLNDGAAEPVDAPSQIALSILAEQPTDQTTLLDAAAKAFVKLFQKGQTDSNSEYAKLASLLAESTNSESGAAKDLLNARVKFRNLNSQVPNVRNVVIASDGSPEDEFLFIRGNSETLGDVVPRRFLAALEADADENSKHYVSGSGRIDLANEIANQKNPLTSRVMVNRVWYHLFGRGIVASVDDFGVIGERPTHPDLLDYLATEFSEDQWSVKRLIRRLVLTRTYRMSSESRPLSDEVDPENRFLHRSNIKRLEGEAIRDSILQVAGSIDSTLFGASVPVHLTEFMQGRGRPRASGPLDGKGRRSIYTETRRNFLPPMMLAFDTPIPFNTIGARHQSNVPAQALILLNDPFVFDQAEKWAQRLTRSYPKRKQRIESAFHRAFGRKVKESELDALNQFLVAQAELHGLDSENAITDQKLWRDFCHVLFNMKEFIYIK